MFMLSKHPPLVLEHNPVAVSYKLLRRERDLTFIAPCKLMYRKTGDTDK
jgi:hypothetical protein